jgi:hypothetical protein
MVNLKCLALDARVVGSSPGRAIVFAFLDKVLNPKLPHSTEV